MKKILSLSISFLLCLCIITSNVFATSEAQNNVNQDLVPEPRTNVSDVQNDIMPISTNWEENNSISQDYVEDDVYMSSEVITLDQSVNGNVYLFGNDVNVNSSMILGNLIVFGDNVNINADITGSIYIVANKVTITGGADDAYIMAETVNFEENSYISRNARVISENLNLKGSIERDLYSLSEKTNILESQFGGVRGKLYYKDNLNVQGDNKVNETIKISDKTTEFKERTETFFDVLVEVINRMVIAAQIFTAAIVIILLCLFIKPKENIEENRNYLIDLLKGFVYMICIPIIAMILMLTIIGIPLSLIIFLVYVVALFLSIPVASIDVARIILKEKADTKWKLILSAIGIYLVLEIIKVIPVIGGIIRFLFIIYGLKLIISFPFKNGKSKKEQDVKDVIVKTEE